MTNFSPFNRHTTCMLLLSIVENNWWVKRYFLKSSDASLTFLSSIFDRRNHNKRSMYRKLSELFFTVEIYIIENMAGHQWHVLRRLWLLTTHICHYFIVFQMWQSNCANELLRVDSVGKKVNSLDQIVST